MNSLRILEVSASGRSQGSVSRMLTGTIVAALQGSRASVDVVRRDLSAGMPLVDEAWITANFTDEADRSAEQRATLAFSDVLVAELQQADVLVIGAPIYNFGVPAALKAWIDMIARARKTFRYTEHGPKGLLKGKQAYIVIASGGVPVDSAVDFATPYLRQALRFIGITDIEVIAAEQLNSKAEASIDAARTRIAALTSSAAARGDIAA
jgi:FMN-dependent NADH-azoreductase